MMDITFENWIRCIFDSPVELLAGDLDYVYYPQKITAIIDDFLARNHNIRGELKEYAERARVGYVQ